MSDEEVLNSNIQKEGGFDIKDIDAMRRLAELSFEKRVKDEKNQKLVTNYPDRYHCKANIPGAGFVDIDFQFAGPNCTDTVSYQTSALGSEPKQITEKIKARYWFRGPEDRMILFTHTESGKIVVGTNFESTFYSVEKGTPPVHDKETATNYWSIKPKRQVDNSDNVRLQNVLMEIQ